MNIFRLFQNKKRKKMYENMFQNAPNCTIQKIFFGEACPQTPPPPQQTHGYATRHKTLRGMPLAQPSRKFTLIGKSCIRPWTTTK